MKRRWFIRTLAAAVVILAVMVIAQRRELAAAAFARIEKRCHLLEINAAARATGFDPKFLAAMVYVESRFKPEAVSASGAVGLMQLMPATAREVAARHRLPYTDSELLSPGVNTLLGALYLRELFTRFSDTDVVVAAYNAGPGTVRTWLDSAAADSGVVAGFSVDETRQYVVAVNQSYARLCRCARLLELAGRWQ